ncbi:hypothetical protein ACGH6U_04545 [Gilliamella sp. CG33]
MRAYFNKRSERVKGSAMPPAIIPSKLFFNRPSAKLSSGLACKYSVIGLASSGNSCTKFDRRSS